MNREKSLLKNTFIISIGKICTSLITFLLLPLYTNLLSPMEYGIIDLFNTIIALLFPIITFQLEKAAFRELLETKDDKEIKKIITTIFITTIIQCMIFVILGGIISLFINNKYKVFLFISVVSYVFLSLLQQIARGLKNIQAYTISSFLSALFIIVFNIFFLLVMKLGIYGMLIGTFLGYLCSGIYLFLKLHIYRYVKWCDFKVKLLKELLKYSIPLIPNAIAWWIFSASDRVIVSSILGIDQNGILSAALKFSVVFITLYNIFDVSWTESTTASIKDDDFEEYYNKMFNIFIRIFLSIGIGIVVCMPIVFPLMINNEYSLGYNLVPISILASFFNIIVGLISVIYVAKKNTKAIANTSIISAIINIFVHLLLIKKFGLYAAVISTCVSFFVMALYRMHDIKKRYFKIIIDKKFIVFSLIVLLIIFICYYLNKFYLNIISLILFILYVYIVNRKSIKIIIELVKKRFKKV